MTNDPYLQELQKQQMHTFAEFLATLDSAKEVMDMLVSQSPYLDFKSEIMIERYYNAIHKMTEGMRSLTHAFREYSASHEINLEDYYPDA